MDTQETKDVILRLRKAGVAFIYFGGGDVFLRDDIFELIRFAEQLGLRSHLTINAFTVTDEIASNGPIDYLEFGVYQGYATRSWTALSRHPESRFFGFDTFEGLPEDWEFFNEIVPRGTWQTGGRPPHIHDPRVKFIKGIFQETLPDFLKTFTPKNRLVINCDADLYTSTLYLLVTLNYLLGPGQIVIFDEFSTVYEFKAFRDFTRSFRRKYELLASADRFCERAAMEFV